jgi:hypothetical protein
MGLIFLVKLHEQDSLELKHSYTVLYDNRYGERTYVEEWMPLHLRSTLFSPT